jgi:hypothetical protein
MPISDVTFCLHRFFGGDMLHPLNLLRIAALTSALASAATLPGPQAELIVNGESVVIPADWRSPDEGKTWQLRWQDQSGTHPLQFLEVDADTDPFLNYAVGFINPFPSSTSFVLNLTMPFVGGPYNQETLNHASTITDGGGGAGATVGLNTELNVASALLNGLVVSGLDSDGCSIPGGSGICFAGPSAITAVSAGATGTFGLRLSFALSGNDAFSSSGNVILDNNNTVVPEPSTYLFIATGLAGMAALRLRSKRKC